MNHFYLDTAASIDYSTALTEKPQRPFDNVSKKVAIRGNCILATNEFFMEEMAHDSFSAGYFSKEITFRNLLIQVYKDKSARCHQVHQVPKKPK